MVHRPSPPFASPEDLDIMAENFQAYRDTVAELSSLIQKPSDQSLYNQVSDHLAANIKSGAVTYEGLSEILPKVGISGDLLSMEFGNIDTWGLLSDGGLSADEISRAANNNSRPLTALAANVARDNMAQIASGSIIGDVMNVEIFEDRLDRYETDKYATDVRMGSELTVPEFVKAPDLTVSDTIVDPGEEIKPTQPVSELQDIVKNRNATPQQRLQAASYLYEQGHRSLEVTESDGSTLHVAIAMEDNMIALFANDGQTRPLLRGMIKNGVVSQQGNANYYGDKWGQRHPDSIFAAVK